jgi:hypothetical protein
METKGVKIIYMLFIFVSVSKYDQVINNSFIHLAVCLTTGPKLLPKRALHIVRSRASSFKWEYSLLSLRSSNSFLRCLVREDKLRNLFLLIFFVQPKKNVYYLILFWFMPLCYIKYNQYYNLTQHFNVCHPMLHVSVQQTIIRHYFTKKN